MQDRHVVGLFGEATRLSSLQRAGLVVAVHPGETDDEDARQPVFVGVRPA